MDVENSPQNILAPTEIVHIISGDLWAGAESQVFQTLRAFSRYHDEIRIRCLLFNEGILSKRLREEGFHVTIIDENRCSALIMLMRITSFFRTFQPDIIHTHHIKEHFLAVFAKRITGFPAPIVRTLHGLSKVPKHLKKMQHLRSSVVVTIDHFLIKYFTDLIIAVSEDLFKKTKKKHVRGDIRHIYNAIKLCSENTNVSGTHLRHRFGTQGKLWVVTATRLVEPKNLGMLIAAGEVLRDSGINVKVSIFGQGPLEKSLKSKILDLNLENHVELNGFTNRLNDILSEADIFVLCSRHEGLPMALIEAMSIGIPVVCTSVGGMQEVIVDKKNGLLVDLDDVQAMAKAIHQLWSDKSLAKRLSSNALATVRDRFDIQKNVSVLKQIYQNLHRTLKH